MGAADDGPGRAGTSPGDVLKERFRIDSFLGNGRFARTFSAVDLETSRRCVVKELSVRDADRGHRKLDSLSSGETQKIVQLFQREAHTLANLDHPGIPRFVDFFTVPQDDDLLLFLVQEYVAGTSLAGLVRSGRNFSEPDVLKLGVEVARILAYLHGMPDPVVHRDVKPENLVLREDGGVSVVDFGAVNHWLGDHEEGGSTIIGTLGYMPIEQYEGRAVPASDIYSLGMTLLAVLTHKEPRELLRDGTRVRIERHTNVTRAFASVLEKMVDADWQHRYQTAGEVADDLVAVLNGRDPKRSRRNRRLLVVSGIAAALLAPGVIAMRSRRAPATKKVFVPSSIEVRTRALETVASVAELEEMLESGYLAGVGRLRLESQGAWREDPDRAFHVLFQSPDLSGLHSLTILGARGMPSSGLAKALPRLVRLTTLDLRNNSIANGGAKALAGVATATSIKNLILSGEGIETAGFAALLRSAAFPRLQALGLSSNLVGATISDVPVMRANADFSYLDLSTNDLKDDVIAAVASGTLLSGLRSVNLAGNQIGPDGARALARCRALSDLALDGLDTLNLSANSIGDDGALALADSTILAGARTLWLGQNGIGDKGALALARSKNLGLLSFLDLSFSILGEGTKAELRARFGKTVKF